MSLAKYKSTLGHLVLIAAFSLVAMLPAFYSGVPSGNDQAQHYQFAWTIYTSITSGEIYPSVAGGTNRGFGDYGLRFYPPLTYYLLSIANLIVRDWYFASLLAFTLVFFTGGVGIYLWAKEEFEPNQALIAALLYTFAPYHLNQIYNNFLMAEFFATAILPFCFLFLMRVCRKGRMADVFGLAIAYAFLILTHLPVAIIGSLALGIYALISLKIKGIFSKAPKLIMAVLSAAAMTAFYWSRMLPEMAWIKHSSPKYFSTIWDYRSNYLMVPDHLLNFQTDVLSLWLADLMLLAMLLISIPAVVVLILKRSFGSKNVLAVSAGFAFAVFMTTPLSSFVWDNLGFLQKVQFPWRWMAIISAFGAIFASIGIIQASNVLKNTKNILLPLGLGSIFVIFVFTAAFITKGPVYVSRTDLNRQMTNVAESEGCECWWPVWAERSAFNQTEKVAVAGRRAEVTVWTSTDKQFHVDAGEPVTAKIAAFYYPRWTATINGGGVQVDRNEDGVMSIGVPAEAADVHLVFREPAYVQAANIASLAAWLSVIFSLSILLFRSRREKP